MNSTDKLILCCANPFALNEELSWQASSEIDWGHFVELARAHRLLPLIHKHFSSLDSATIPERVKQEAVKAYRATAVRMEFLAARLDEINGRLREANIRFVPWKGPHLAKLAYGDMALRPADDLDFLVHPDDMLGAIDALSALGLRPKLLMKSSTQSRYLAAGYEYIMVSPDSDLHVELTSRPIPPPSPLDGNLLDIWNSDSGILTPERYFIFLCMHGAKHCWDRLIWISDLCAFLSSHPQLSEDLIEDIARATSVQNTLGAAKTLMIAAGFRPATLKRNSMSPPLSTLVRNSLCAEGLSAWEKTLRHLSMYSRFIDKVRHVARWLFAPTFSDWEAVDLPSRFQALYWIVRPFRILTRKASD